MSPQDLDNIRRGEMMQHRVVRTGRGLWNHLIQILSHYRHGKGAFPVGPVVRTWHFKC